MFPETGETPLYVRALDTKPHDLSLVPSTHKVETTDSCRLDSDYMQGMYTYATHTHTCKHMYIHAYTPKQIKCN